MNDRLRIAVVGGGINGSGIAWELVRRDHRVTLYEKKTFGSGTSSASSKLIHGGLRYLEHFEIGLVREALHERAFLLAHVPDLVSPLEIILPIYGDSPRSRLTISVGLKTYDALAGKYNVAPHKPWSAAELKKEPLRPEGLRGAFSFYDAQVDDLALVRRVVRCGVRDGVDAREQTEVQQLGRTESGIEIRSVCRGEMSSDEFDCVVNAAGPWMNEYLERTGVTTKYRLSLIRGSHIILRQSVSTRGFLLQSSDKRVLFVLPWKGRTLVGTTEVVHEGSLEQIVASDEEIDYLLTQFSRYFSVPAGRDDIVETFAGVRPLIGRASNPRRISREYKIEKVGRGIINVFGGKLTTFMSLSRSVADEVDALAGTKRRARPALF